MIFNNRSMLLRASGRSQAHAPETWRPGGGSGACTRNLEASGVFQTHAPENLEASGGFQARGGEDRGHRRAQGPGRSAS